ncbi:MAG: sugar ABC transporter permease [Clostridia bacterium]|nr:sugar ABC transporter permease [Clostridia bacterium]
MERTIVLEEYAKQRSKRIGSLRKYGVTAIFLLPYLLSFIVFFVIPLFYGVYISLTNFQYGKPGVETFNDFAWFRMLFDKTFMPGVYNSFWLAFVHTVMFSVIMIPIAILLPLSLAILVNKKPPGFKLFRALIYMPSIVPLTAAGTIFTLLFLPKSQNGLLAEFFGVEIKWFIDTWFSFDLFGQTVDISYAWIPIFLMCLWGGWGGNFIILSAGLQNVPRHLYEAADIDGCSSFRKIMNVTIPGIKPQLVLCLFTTILGYLGLYGQNYVLSSGGPSIAAIASMPAGGQTSTLMYFIQDIVANNLQFKSSLYGLGAAASLVYALFAGIISGIQMYLTREKKTGTKISEAYNKWHEIR